MVLYVYTLYTKYIGISNKLVFNLPKAIAVDCLFLLLPVLLLYIHLTTPTVCLKDYGKPKPFIIYY